MIITNVTIFRVYLETIWIFFIAIVIIHNPFCDAFFLHAPVVLLNHFPSVPTYASTGTHASTLLAPSRLPVFAKTRFYDKVRIHAHKILHSCFISLLMYSFSTPILSMKHVFLVLFIHTYE